MAYFLYSPRRRTVLKLKRVISFLLFLTFSFTSWLAPAWAFRGQSPIESKSQTGLEEAFSDSHFVDPSEWQFLAGEGALQLLEWVGWRSNRNSGFEVPLVQVNGQAKILNSSTSFPVAEVLQKLQEDPNHRLLGLSRQNSEMVLIDFSQAVNHGQAVSWVKIREEASIPVKIEPFTEEVFLTSHRRLVNLLNQIDTGYPKTVEELKAELRDPAFSFIARDSKTQRIVGGVAAYRWQDSPKNLFLSWIVVDRPYRNQAVGRLLMEAVLHQASRDRKIQGVIGDTRKTRNSDDQKQQVQFFLRLGAEGFHAPQGVFRFRIQVKDSISMGSVLEAPEVNFLEELSRTEEAFLQEFWESSEVSRILPQLTLILELGQLADRVKMARTLAEKPPLPGTKNYRLFRSVMRKAFRDPYPSEVREAAEMYWETFEQNAWQPLIEKWKPHSSGKYVIEIDPKLGLHNEDYVDGSELERIQEAFQAHINLEFVSFDPDSSVVYPNAKRVTLLAPETLRERESFLPRQKGHRALLVVWDRKRRQTRLFSRVFMLALVIASVPEEKASLDPALKIALQEYFRAVDVTASSQDIQNLLLGSDEEQTQALWDLKINLKVITLEPLLDTIFEEFLGRLRRDLST